jgi:hypothetical protein
MWKLLIVVTLGACTTTRTNKSTLPAYVRDLRPMQGGMQMVQCETTVTTTREHDWFWGGNSTTREITGGQCWTQVISTMPMQPPPPQPAPGVTP